ncbi:putative E3 ubiquitin-protein ligase TRIML2 [Rhynchocyon petersi]
MREKDGPSANGRAIYRLGKLLGLLGGLQVGNNPGTSASMFKCVKRFKRANRNSPLPQEIPDYYCKRHSEPPKVFCAADHVVLCGKCIEEHKGHTLCGLEEASDNYRKLCQAMQHELNKKLELTKSLLSDEQDKVMTVQKEEQNYKEMVESEYRIRYRLLNEENKMSTLRPPGCLFGLKLREPNLNQPVRFGNELEEQFQDILQKLRDLTRENMNNLQESEVWLSEQICNLQGLIAELEKICNEPPLTLLQKAKDCLERSESLLLQCVRPAYVKELTVCQATGMSTMLRSFQRYVTLDPETAHPCLYISEDLRTVKVGKFLTLPSNPGALDFSVTVLGMESFTSGKHYWEVDVSKATNWQLGIFRDCTNKPGAGPRACGDKVLLTRSTMGSDCSFWVFPPLKRICLRQELYKVGIFLDYDYGQVSFYNVTEKCLVYNLSYLALQGSVRPVFAFCVPCEGLSLDSGSLTICPPQYPPDAANC